jgi:dihydroorotate dehydrogenase
MAAGFDKNAVAAPILSDLGFGFVEIGTVTPEPQSGNPRPRLFRLRTDQALINRLGFNSQGLVEVTNNLYRIGLTQRERGFIMGVNLGANRTSVEEGRAVDDYVNGTHLLGRWGDYITINISSPNTTNLRNLQGKEALTQLVKEVVAERDKSAQRPVLVKIAPDLERTEVDDILDVVLSNNLQGIIATNTTVSRPALKSSFASETGGLSGRPLNPLTLNMIRYLYRSTEGKIPIIGVGGIFNGEDAAAMMASGATLVQQYTGFIYEGPFGPTRILRYLSEYLKRRDFSSIQELVGEAAKAP